VEFPHHPRVLIVQAVQQNAIVLIVDRLGAGFLGPYGNTWIETPHWNRLAAAAALFEFAITDSTHLPSVYRSWWHGTHAMAAEARTDIAASLPAMLHRGAVRSALLTDDALVAALPEAAAFDERMILTPALADRAAATIEETELAKLFAAAIEWLQTAESPFLLWIHARGMHGLWDAPAEFRNRFAEGDDPVPPEFVAAPQRQLMAGTDPDEILGIVQAYAGQVALLDVCLGALLGELDSRNIAADTLMLATAPRGYPLGEHGIIGAANARLHEELIHVPLVIRAPQSSLASVRSQSLVQPPDVFATLRDWFACGDAHAIAGGDDSAGGTVRDASATSDRHQAVWGQPLLALADDVIQPGRDRAATIDEGQAALRTPAWLWQQLADGCQQLYAKPDDRWEANEVSTRCRSIADDMHAAWRDFAQAVQRGNPGDLMPLSEILLAGLD
jgi:arylsulfatase A-like enzyme